MKTIFFFFCVWGMLLLAGCGQPGSVKFEELTKQAYAAQPVWGSVEYVKPVVRLQQRYLYKGEPYTGTVTGRFANMNVVEFKGKMRQGLPDGVWTYYFNTGRKKMEGRYVAGNPDSIWQKYFYDGRNMVTERYQLMVDTLFCDTTALWYKGGVPCKTMSGDTFITYYPSGKWQVYTVGKPAKFEWHYTEAGKVTSAFFNDRREDYNADGKLLSKTYMTYTVDGKNTLGQDYYAWTLQNKNDIKKADSVQFDYSNAKDPVVRIFQGK